MKILIAILLTLGLAACVQMPTQSTQVVDDRPRVAFDPVAVQGKVSDYEVIIDGINYGSISQYLVEENTLPIVAGRHTVEVRRKGTTVFTQDVVLGANTTRVIKVVDND